MPTLYQIVKQITAAKPFLKDIKLALNTSKYNKKKYRTIMEIEKNWDKIVLSIDEKYRPYMVKYKSAIFLALRGQKIIKSLQRIIP